MIRSSASASWTFRATQHAHRLGFGHTVGESAPESNSLERYVVSHSHFPLFNLTSLPPVEPPGESRAFGGHVGARRSLELRRALC